MGARYGAMGTRYGAMALEAPPRAPPRLRLAGVLGTARALGVFVVAGATVAEGRGTPPLSLIDAWSATASSAASASKAASRSSSRGTPS
eukprot:jgi/Chrpa1/21888/Chrysochromulina_OHIO_Genome00001203-RA